MYWDENFLINKGISWVFPSNNDGKIDGLNDAGIELFRDSRISSLAREIIQNSLDAADPSVNKPIEVDFNLFKMDSNIFPNKDIFLKTLNECLENWKGKSEVKLFFEQAINVLNDTKINILKVSDFNTIGLEGSNVGENDFSSKWYSLIKAAGVCNKDSNGAGGSFGIGKYAPFACSDLRTVFYGTVDRKGCKAFQGKSILVSHYHNNCMTQGTGFFGITHKNQPILNEIADYLPSFYSKDKIGTDIFIMGFNGDSQWKSKLIAAVLENFFVAIYKKKLVIKIDDVFIDNSTMPGLIDSYISDNTLTAGYYKAISLNDNNIKFYYEENFKGLGRIELYLIMGNDLPKRVAMVRATGMKIEDKGHFRNATKFSGVFLALGDKINDFLRKCEDPRHDKWIAERYTSDPKYASEVINDLLRWINDKVRQLVTYDSSKDQDIPGLSKYLPDDIPSKVSDGNKDNDKLSIETKPAEAKIKRKEVKPWYEKNWKGETINAHQGGSDISILNGNKHNNSNGGKQKKILDGYEDNKGNQGSNYNKNGRDPSKKPEQINIKETRSYCYGTSNKYIISFIPLQDISKGYFELKIIGDSSDIEYAPVLKAIDKRTGNNLAVVQEKDSFKIEVGELKAKQKYIYEVLLRRDERCAMEVDVYEHKMA